MKESKQPLEVAKFNNNRKVEIIFGKYGFCDNFMSKRLAAQLQQ